jgi:hypothetical protein
MTDEITPALTPAQWAVVERWDTKGMSNSYLGDAVSDYDGYANERHALVAIALYQQPFGFTQADADFLADMQMKYSGEWGDAAASLRARIEALLPPRQPDLLPPTP